MFSYDPHIDTLLVTISCPVNKTVLKSRVVKELLEETDTAYTIHIEYTVHDKQYLRDTMASANCKQVSALRIHKGRV